MACLTSVFGTSPVISLPHADSPPMFHLMSQMNYLDQCAFKHTKPTYFVRVSRIKRWWWIFHLWFSTGCWSLWCYKVGILSTLLIFCEVNPLTTNGPPSQRSSHTELWFFFVSPNKMWTNIEIASKLRSHVTRVTLPQWDVSTQCPMQTNNLPRNFHFQNLIFTSYIGVRLCWTLSAQFLQQRNRGNQITCFIITKANKGCHTDSLKYISIQTSQHVF